jgi:hypothetical protein
MPQGSPEAINAIVRRMIDTRIQPRRRVGLGTLSDRYSDQSKAHHAQMNAVQLSLFSIPPRPSL